MNNSKGGMRMIRRMKAKLSVLLVFCLVLSALSSAVSGVYAEESRVVETDSHILIMQDYYHLEIEKSGFKYSFKKPDGTVIADKHNISGIRFTAPGGNVLSDAVSTELLSDDPSVVRMLVTNADGGKAWVNAHLFDHYMKFEIIPISDGDESGAVKESRLIQSDTQAEGFITAGDTAWTNYTFEAAMKAGNMIPGSSASGIVLRYQDYDNFYHLRLHHGKGEIQLLKKLNGSFTVVEDQSVSLTRDQWYVLKAEVNDDVISVYLDGVKQFSYIDPADVISSGAIGMRTYKDQVSFRDLVVRIDEEVVFEDEFAADNLEDWNVRSGLWSVSQEDIIQSYIIDARTAPLSPAYGLGDHGRNGQSSNIFGFSNHDITNKGGEERFISNFTIFPAHGFAQVLFEEGKKRVTINGNENKLGVADVQDVKSLYYFIGDMERIYKDYQTVRYAEGYPDYLPKYKFFEVGYEAFGSLGWNTYQSSVTQDLQTYMDKGYDLKWAVVGSGFWKGDRSNPNEGATTSFGIWDDEAEEERNDSLPNPRYPDVDAFKQFLADHGLKFFLGLRVNFKAPAEDGGHHHVPHDGPYTYEGIDRGYFLTEANGQPRKFTVNFPKGNVYLLDTNNEEALEWYVDGVNLWEVDGFKEDTMMVSRLYQDGLWNRSNEKLMEEGYYVMVRNAAYSIPGDIIRLEDTMHGFNQDRPIINALNYAASGAPNVYADIIAGKYLTTPLSEDQKLYFVRNAMFGALTPAISVGLGPWKMENEAYEAAVKKAIDFHSMYAPYIYSAAVDSYHTGFPHTMTPLPIAFPDEPATYELANRTTRQYAWMLGPSMLAVPAYGEDYATVTSRDVYLPAGKWIDYETGTVYHGPIVLEDYELPIDKIPVFIGGKGVIVNRELHGDRLFAEVFPIAKDGSAYQFTYPDGISTSVIRNDNVNWNPETLVIKDITTQEEVEFIYNEVTGSFKFELTSGHDYVLTDGEYEEILNQVELSLDKQADLLVGEQMQLSIEGRLLSGELADLANAQIQYHSDDEQVVIVNDKGRLSAVGTGEANVKALVTLNGITIGSNSLHLKVVEPELEIITPHPATEFASQPVVIAGRSAGFESLELRINGTVIPVEVSGTGEWQASVNHLPNGDYGVQVIGRDSLGKIRAADGTHLSIQMEEILYYTDFTEGHSEWQMTSGNWAVRPDGDTMIYGASSNGITYTGDPEWGDYSIESRVIIHAPGPNQGGGAGGVVFRYQDSGNFYHFRLDHLQRPEQDVDLKSAQLFKWVNGTAEKMAEVPYDYLYDEWIDMRVIVEGDHIKAYLNDELVIEAKDSSIKQGQVGFRTHGRSFSASDMTVKNLLMGASLKAPTWINDILLADDVSGQSVTLSWSGARGAEGAVAYRIDMNDVPGLMLPMEELTVTGSVYSYTVQGLTPETEYVFKVEAGNIHDLWSTDGPVVIVTTLPDEDPGDPNEPGDPDETDPDDPGEPGDPDDPGEPIDNEPSQPPIVIPPADEQEDPETNPAGEPLFEARVEAVEDAIADALADQGTGDTARVRLAGQVYEVTIIAKDEGVAGELSEPLSISLNYDAADVDEDLLGVYYYNEVSEQWEYVGGEADKELDQIRVDITTAGLYAVFEYDKSFVDVSPDHWVYTALKQLAARHIVKGVSDEEFAPQGQTTRAEFAALLVRALGLSTESATIPFADVAEEAWYAKEVAAAYSAGLIQGLSAEEFGPNEQISREQMATMLVRAYEYRLGELLSAADRLTAFADGESVSSWARDHVNLAIELGLMQGRGTDQFAPRAEATRAETAMVIWNLLNLLP